jgi:hypothetical protein
MPSIIVIKIEMAKAKSTGLLTRISFPLLTDKLSNRSVYVNLSLMVLINAPFVGHVAGWLNSFTSSNSSANAQF